MSLFVWVCQWETGTFAGFFVCSSWTTEINKLTKLWGLYGVTRDFRRSHIAVTSDPDGEELWAGGICSVWGPIPLLRLLTRLLLPARLRAWDSRRQHWCSLPWPGKRLGNRIIPFDMRRKRERPRHIACSKGNAFPVPSKSRTRRKAELSVM